MDRDDAMLALERHATSKIKEANDLDHLASYGFRGEALPSIASVSRFNLQTRAKGDDIGTEVLVNGGRFVHVRDCGRPVGTRIEVAQLFNSVPARTQVPQERPDRGGAHCAMRATVRACPPPMSRLSSIEDGRTIFRSPECTQPV
jgi:DNA mismatch repair protein MutL